MESGKQCAAALKSGTSVDLLDVAEKRYGHLAQGGCDVVYVAILAVLVRMA